MPAGVRRRHDDAAHDEAAVKPGPRCCHIRRDTRVSSQWGSATLLTPRGVGWAQPTLGRPATTAGQHVGHHAAALLDGGERAGFAAAAGQQPCKPLLPPASVVPAACAATELRPARRVCACSARRMGSLPRPLSIFCVASRSPAIARATEGFGGLPVGRAVGHHAQVGETSAAGWFRGQQAQRAGEVRNCRRYGVMRNRLGGWRGD